MYKSACPVTASSGVQSESSSCAANDDNGMRGEGREMGLAVGRHISLDRRSGAKCPIDFSAPPAAMLHPVSPPISIAMAEINSGL